jgi:hypothetical protein
MYKILNIIFVILLGLLTFFSVELIVEGDIGLGIAMIISVALWIIMMLREKTP